MAFRPEGRFRVLAKQEGRFLQANNMECATRLSFVYRDNRQEL